MDLQTVLQPIFSTRAASNTATSVSSWGGLFGGSVLTKKGKLVNQNTSLTLSAFYNGIEIITNDFAKLPKAVYKKEADSRNKQSNHPVNYLISKRPNQYMTAFMFDKMMIQYAILKGNGYAQIIRNELATPIAFELIDQDKTPVEVIKYNNLLWYKVNGKIIRAEDMLHIPGFSFNGITGVSVITAAANSLGINLSAQEFATDYYETKGVGVGVVGTTKEMDATAKIRYGQALSEALSKANSDFNVAVVDEGASFNHIKITPQESQFLLTQKNGVEEVARWLNLYPHKLKTLDNINNSITENLEIQHVLDSMMPWAMKFEQEYDVKLFSQAEINAGYYIKANLTVLLRGDLKARAEFYSKLVLLGVITRNEARAFEDLNPLEGLEDPLTPVNTQTMEQIDMKLEQLKKDI